MNDMNTYSVICIETTGLNSDASRGPVDKIIQISCLKLREGKIIEAFDSYVNNKTKISQEASELTGITDNDVKNAPSIKVVLKRLKEFVGESTLVAHNIRFDYGFIDLYGKKCGIEFANPKIDLLQIAKDKIEGIKNYRVLTVADYYGVEHIPGAGVADVIMQALMFFKMQAMYGEDIEKYKYMGTEQNSI